MSFKYVLSYCVMTVGLFGAASVVASAPQPGSSAAETADVPEGFIVVKVLPAREASSSKTSNAPRQITDRRDPEYVRCRLEPVAGSILKKRKICMTNHQWTLAIRKGNQYAREFVDDNQPGFMLQ